MLANMMQPQGVNMSFAQQPDFQAAMKKQPLLGLAAALMMHPDFRQRMMSQPGYQGGGIGFMQNIGSQMMRPQQTQSDGPPELGPRPY